MSASLKRRGQIGGLVIIGSLILTVLFGVYGVNKIRFGGPLYEHDAELGDFDADLIPPGLTVLAPMLEATLLVEERTEGKNTVEPQIERLKKLEKNFLERDKHWKSSTVDPDLLAQLNEKVAPRTLEFWKTVNQRLIPAARRGDVAAMNSAHEELHEQFRAEEQAVADLIAQTTKRDDLNSEAAATSTAWTVAVLAICVLAIIAMIVGAMLYLIRQALNPMADTADVMTRMGKGDLDAGRRTEHRGDEIGQMTTAIEVFRAAAIAQRENEQKQKAVVEEMSSALGQLADGDLVHRIDRPLAPEYETLRATYNSTIDRISDLMQRVSSTASSVSTGAAEIRAASDDLALRNEQQAASLEETAAAMNQVTGIVGETAKGAADVQRSIAETHHEATEGGVVVRRAIDGMAAIERSSEEISQIINVIDGIAFQTNLLALNAGVEAARAGDAGKGFAVVANEVRALAQRSADAAKDIKALITASTGQVANGVTLVGETGALLEKIVTRVGAISELVKDIAHSTENQATNLKQVNASVGDMDRMTQQNAAMVEESTAAARSLAEEAGELTELVSQFRTSGQVIRVGAAVPARRTARAAPVPQVRGNLALQATDGDWSEF